MVEDACTGQHAVKARGEEYLPRPNPGDYSIEANARYQQYLTRAVYYNAAGRTLSSLVGMAFQKWPEVTNPKVLDYLVDDADGAGSSLVQSCQMTLAEVLKTGRAGLLVDFPVVENTAETSVADVKSGNAVATINLYPAHSIINWQTFSIGANEITRFLQQSQASAVLNRVAAGNPSQILGALQSNGRVFLINPSGIVFGAGAQVDVAGLVASSLNL